MTKAKELPIAAAGTVASNIVRDVRLGQLQENLSNPRRTMNDADLAELAASIREHGVNVPLLVRPISVDGEFTFYEVVCGHRRSYAATQAGLDSVPCIVREMTDEQAAEIALIDNLQRVDVPAVEEAEAFKQLLPRLGSIAAVAAKVGKEQAYVAKRLRLCALTVWSADALRAKLITIDHALLLARLAADEQDAALKWTIDKSAGVKTRVGEVVASRMKIRDDANASEWQRQWEPETVQQLKHHIEEKTGIKLDRAPWDLDQDYLAGTAPPCNGCEKNTKANAPLFGDLDIGAATCTDGQCFKAKTSAFVEIKLREAGQDLTKKPAKRIARLSWQFSSVRPKTGFNDDLHNGGMNTCADTTKVIKAGAWIEAKKNSCPNVRPGITVDWSDANDRGYMGNSKKLRGPGETLQVCIACGCKVHRKEYEKAKEPASSNGSQNQNSEAAKAARERKAELVKAENAVRAEQVKAAIGKVDKLTSPLLRRLILSALPDEWVRVGGSDEMFPGLDDGLEKLKTDSAEFARAAACILFLEAQSDVWVSEWEPVEKGRKEFVALLKDLGHDATKAWGEPDEPKAKKSILSAAAKRRIAEAQKKRWAAAKKVTSKPAKKAAKKKGAR